MAEQVQRAGVSPALQVSRGTGFPQQNPQLLNPQQLQRQQDPQLDGFLSNAWDVVGRVAKRAGNALTGGASFLKNSAAVALWDSSSPSYAKVTQAGGGALGLGQARLAAWKNALDITGVGLAVCSDAINDPNPDKDLALGREFLRALQASQPGEPAAALRQKANTAARSVYATLKNQILFGKEEAKQPPAGIQGTLDAYLPGMAKAFYAPFAERLSGSVPPAQVRDPAGWPQREKGRQDKIAKLQKELDSAQGDVAKKTAQAKLDAIQLVQDQKALQQKIGEADLQAGSLQETAYLQQQELSLQAEQLSQQAAQARQDLEAQERLWQRRQDTAKKVAGVVLGLAGIGAILYVFFGSGVDRKRAES